jgi:hypothetical protein
MNTTRTEQRSLHVNEEQLLVFVRAVLGGAAGREDDEHPLPPGPWDPVIRAGLERVSFRSFGEEVALNPQPLPPRAAFLIAAARAVIERAELLQELSGALANDGSRQGIIIVGGYTARYSDEWCATGFKLRWPLPGPRPHWFPHELDGIDLLVVATQFEQAAKAAFDQELREHLRKTCAKFTEVGMSRLRVLLDGKLTTVNPR